MSLTPEDVASVLAEHDGYPSESRNLGQYRTEWECDCGYKFITDAHKGEYHWDKHRAHVADHLGALLNQHVEAARREAWDEGKRVGHVEINTGQMNGTPNPYRAGDGGRP